MTKNYPTFTDTGLAALRDGAGRPLLLTNATVHTLDPLIGTMTGADVLIGGDVIVGVGPGIVTAADDDGAIVIDASGTMILPARPDLIARLGSGLRGGGDGSLAPGAQANLIVVRDTPVTGLADALALASTPEGFLAVLVDGAPVHWAGRPLDGEPVALPNLTETVVDQDRVGVWIDTEDFLHQELDAGGRYDETRGGRPHAFQGRYWVDGDRIDYLDDLGFWAFGRFDGATLHHAGYTMTKGETR